MASSTKLEMNWLPIQKRKGGPLGLRNLGNTCYLNSVLQCLTYTPPLANLCLLSHHSSSCNGIPNSNSSVCAFCLVEKRIFRSLTIESASDSPSKIYSCLTLFAKHFRQGWQEDAHEFLRYVIEACNSVCVKLHKLLTVAKLRTRQDIQKHSKEEPRTVVKDIFGGVLQSQVKCLSCSTESNKLDDIMDLSLDVFKIASVKEAMCRYFQPEILDGNNKYKCEKCKKLTAARKQMSIFQAPNVLVIQLKRFENIHGGKIDRHIGFEERLELQSHMCKGSQDKKPEYLLYAIIVHAGSSQDSGHYYSYVKDINGKWFCCNDAHVTSASPKSVLAEKAYILFYVRHSPKATSKSLDNCENGHGDESLAHPSDPETHAVVAKENGWSDKKVIANVSSCSADKGQGVHQVRFNIIKPPVHGPSRRLRSNADVNRSVESWTENRQSNGIHNHTSTNGTANHVHGPNNGYKDKHGDQQEISEPVVKASNGTHEPDQVVGHPNSLTGGDVDSENNITCRKSNESEALRLLIGEKRKVANSPVNQGQLVHEDANCHAPVVENTNIKQRLVNETRQLLLQSGWCDTVRDSFRALKKARVQQGIIIKEDINKLRDEFKIVQDSLRQKVPNELKEHLVEELQAHFASQTLKS